MSLVMCLMIIVLTENKLTKPNNKQATGVFTPIDENCIIRDECVKFE